MLRGSLVELIYRKTMAMEPIAIQESTPLTLMSADIERISTGFPLLHDFWASILQIPLALYLLWREVGVASMAPLGVAICRHPFLLIYVIKASFNYSYSMYNWGRIGVLSGGCAPGSLA